MDFSKIKSKLSTAKEKVIEIKNNTIQSAAKKIGESSIVILRQEDLEDFIKKSENKTITTESGEEKTYTKRVLVIIGDSKKDFYKDMLISLPIILTKAYSQNIHIKLLDSSNEKIDISVYNLEVFPAIIVFENKEIIKIISGEEKLKKVVKSFTLDINKIVDEL